MRTILYYATLFLWLLAIGTVSAKVTWAQSCYLVGKQSPKLYQTSCIQGGSCSEMCQSDECYSCEQIGWAQACVPASYCGRYTFCQDSIGCI